MVYKTMKKFPEAIVLLTYLFTLHNTTKNNCKLMNKVRYRQSF